MTNTVLSYPIPAYQNIPIEPQFYKPSQFVITDIVLGQTTIVTMANGTNDVAPNYVIGQQVRLIIPPKYGSRSLNGKVGYVLTVPTTNSVEVSINSVDADPFIPSPTFIAYESRTPAQIVAIGDINSGVVNSSGNMATSTLIPGSFQNISPQ